MATYAELLSASTDQTLGDKIMVACVVSAETIRTESTATPNHTERLKWAQKVFFDPGGVRNQMVWAVLAQNRAFTSAQILAATDSATQTAVDAAVNVFAIAP